MSRQPSPRAIEQADKMLWQIIQSPSAATENASTCMSAFADAKSGRQLADKLSTLHSQLVDYYHSLERGD
ncbi:hypothetical protein EV683_1521 [Crenobacter luteus]|nr:hypothetical protein EV683_1521 [Crenobacter luteus]